MRARGEKPEPGNSANIIRLSYFRCMQNNLNSQFLRLLSGSDIVSEDNAFPLINIDYHIPTKKKIYPNNICLVFVSINFRGFHSLVII